MIIETLKLLLSAYFEAFIKDSFHFECPSCLSRSGFKKANLIYRQRHHCLPWIFDCSVYHQFFIWRAWLRKPVLVDFMRILLNLTLILFVFSQAITF